MRAPAARRLRPAPRGPRPHDRRGRRERANDFAPRVDRDRGRGQALPRPGPRVPAAVDPGDDGPGPDERGDRRLQRPLRGLDAPLRPRDRRCCSPSARRAGRNRAIGAVGVYSLGVLALSGIVLGGSDIDEAPLALVALRPGPGLPCARGRPRPRERSVGHVVLPARDGRGGQGVPARAVPGARRATSRTRGGRRSPRPFRSLSRSRSSSRSATSSARPSATTPSARSRSSPWRRRRWSSPTSTTSAAGARFGSGSFNYVGPGSELARAVDRRRADLPLRARPRRRVARPRDLPPAALDRPARDHRDPLAGALAAVPVLAAAALGGRLRLRRRRTGCWSRRSRPPS